MVRRTVQGRGKREIVGLVRSLREEAEISLAGEIGVESSWVEGEGQMETSEGKVRDTPAPRHTEEPNLPRATKPPTHQSKTRVKGEQNDF